MAQLRLNEPVPEVRCKSLSTNGSDGRRLSARKLASPLLLAILVCTVRPSCRPRPVITLLLDANPKPPRAALWIGRRGSSIETTNDVVSMLDALRVDVRNTGQRYSGPEPGRGPDLE